MADEVNSGTDFEIRPSDLMTSLATLIGLLFTALGLLANAKLPAGAFESLATVLVILMILFSITAFLTAMSAWTGRTDYWNFARALFPVSLLGFCIGAAGMLLVIIYGPGIFAIHIPKLNFNANILGIFLPAFTAILAAVSAYYARRQIERNAQIRLSAAKISPEVTDEVQTDLREEQQDSQMAFLKKAIQVEDELRKLSIAYRLQMRPFASAREIAKALRDRGIMTLEVYKLFDAVWDIRNRTVHAYEVPNKVARQSLNAAVDLLEELRSLESRAQSA